HAHQPVGRVRLRRPCGARRSGAAARRERGGGAGHRRERLRSEPLRARAAGSGSADPYERRAPHLELPALAGGVLGARVRRQVLAGLRRARPARRARGVRIAPPAVRRALSAFFSRILVALVLLPAVLCLAYVGGWWWFALGGLASLIALHEFWLLARASAPLALAGYIGTALTLVGAKVGGFEWMVGGLLVTLPLAFYLKVVSRARQAPTAAISTTVLGPAWVGLGVAFLLLLRALPDHGRLAIFTVLLAV